MAKPNCQDQGGGEVTGGRSIMNLRLAMQFAKASETHTRRIRRSDIPPGEVLVVVPYAVHEIGRPFMRASLYRPPAPTCAVPLPDQHD